MFRFTIREVLGLTTIAAISFPAANLFAPADPIAQSIMALYLAVFGAGCFIGGVALGRRSKISS
ncbi:MAG TPA: hypothetical protein VFV87_03730 [Pirellulaceae bacterium]|nr:hypothetical protein [Pirellulaceae bacterium]